MGIFYNKLMESAVEEVIQTPDDIGVDLDAIEKNIVGKDGCEAHREEIDDAMEGVVGDPLEECGVMMYESEYNFNQLMRCIGVAELNEVYNGNDFVLEGGNLAGFFDGIRDAIVNLFKRVTNAFKNAIEALSVNLGNDKKLASHAEEIRAGYKDGKWSFKDAFDFDALNVDYQPMFEGTEKLTSHYSDIILKAIDGDDGWKNDDNLNHAKIASKISAKNITSENAAGELMKVLTDEAFKKVDYSSDGKKPSVNNVIDILKRGDAEANIRSHYKTIKDSYSKTLKWLADEKKALLAKNTDKGEKKSVDAVISACCRAASYEKSCHNVVFSTCLKAHKTRQHQARKMALVWYNLGRKEKPAAKNESGLFSITII